MGTTPNFDRHFLNLRRFVEVKKLGNLFLGGATLVNKFFWKSICFGPRLSLYKCRNVEMDFPKLPKENGKGKLKI